MPEESFSHTATTSASLDEVWSALNRPQSWEAIPGVDHVLSSSIDSEGRLRGFTFESSVAARKYRGNADPAAWVEGRVMGWDITSSEVKGTIMVEISAANPGTRVKVDLTARSAGMLSSMFFPVIAKAIGSGFPRAVNNFAQGLDA